MLQSEVRETLGHEDCTNMTREHNFLKFFWTTLCGLNCRMQIFDCTQGL